MALDLKHVQRTQQNPPLLHDYTHLLHHSTENGTLPPVYNHQQHTVVMEECELPLITLNHLNSEDEKERMECEKSIVRAASEWGFFQVVNHGVSLNLFKKIRREQVNLFDVPFEKKKSCGILNNSYRWGNPSATNPKQFSWSEYFHIPLTNIYDESSYGEFCSLREVVVEYVSAMHDIAKMVKNILVMNMCDQKNICDDEISTCFLRLNRYPPCPVSSSFNNEVYGLMPHTDTDFHTILYQDEVGGLQIMKDDKWMVVKPYKDALIVNIGDLFQAWSNDVYRSIEHKVIPNPKVERFSVAYFLCPTNDSLIGNCNKQPSVYKRFTFHEYKDQIQKDVKFIGHKVGLSRFRL